jgi:alkylhydroperoxidase family enzyme
MNLPIIAVLVVLPIWGLPKSPPPRFSAAETADAWALLPRENPPLPAWALVLVKSLPRTTGSMLELDRLHRAENPLGPVLAAKLRWLAADAIDCEYARATALGDLKRAGVNHEEVRRLTEGNPSTEELGLFAFARQMTKAAYLVTDAEFDKLLKQFGPEKMTAVVHTLAFANFENRIFLALGVKIEPRGPCPPLAAKLDAKGRADVATPGRPAWERVTEAKLKKKYDAPADWKEVTFDELEKSLTAQKARTSRMPLPDSSRFEMLPPSVKEQTDTIAWMTINVGYQPTMTQAWFATFREFQQEAKLNRVFSSSLFWVVTRSNECFY